MLVDPDVRKILCPLHVLLQLHRPSGTAVMLTLICVCVCVSESLLYMCVHESEETCVSAYIYICIQ